MAEDTENLQEEKLNAEQQAEENNIPTIDNIDNVPPLDVEMFQQKTMSDLFNKPDNTPEKQWLYQQINDYLQAGSFTEEDAHNLNHPVYNEIYQNYLNDLTYDIKSDVFSLDADKVNSAIEKLQNLACMQFAGNLESAKQFDKVMRIRLSSVPQLEYAFETAVVGRDIFNMINSSSNSVATQIEVENKVQSLEDLHDYKIIDNEQMAFGYHNIAILMEQLSRKKSDRMGNNNEQLASYDYMGKALRLTSNPQLIKTCFEYLPDNMIMLEPAKDIAHALDSEFFEKLFAEAITVAEERNVPLYCGEYGVINLTSPEDTLKWYQSIHAVFEKYGIGRAAWSYKEMDFGLIDEHMDPVREEVIREL